jgi:hypothetical protein
MNLKKNNLSYLTALSNVMAADGSFSGVLLENSYPFVVLSSSNTKFAHSSA